MNSKKYFYTYILYSKSCSRYYCGSTNNLKRRIKQHNDPEYKGSLTTKRFKGPWELVWKQEFNSRSDAMALEKVIKKRGIGRYLEKAIQ